MVDVRVPARKRLPPFVPLIEKAIERYRVIGYPGTSEKVKATSGDGGNAYSALSIG